jgi:sulfatase maturation enzyme AslB (radical SAM superfamily)
MKKSEVLNAWASILVGRQPSLSIEITRECPLRCPGCYAYEPEHLGTGVNLRQLSDYKGDDLVRRLLAIVDREKPIHLSLVGGDPLVRTAWDPCAAGHQCLPPVTKGLELAF